jgi:hypothetical protein
MCRYSLLFSSGLAPALGWEMEQSCQSRRSLDRHGGLNGRIAGFVGAVWPRENSEMKEEKQEIRARGRCFSKAPRSGKSDNRFGRGRDDVGFWWVQWPAEDRGAVR